MIDKLFDSNLFKIIVMIAVSLIIYKIIIFFSDKMIKKIIANKKMDNRLGSLVKVIDSIIKYVLLIIIVLIILQMNGVNVTALLTGVGLISVIGGFALQDTLKDLIMGVTIIFEDFYRVGDVIKYESIEGKVINFGLKTTKIQDIYNNDIITISNRDISKVSKVSDWLDIDIPVSYDEKVERVEKVISKISEDVKKIKTVSNCEYKGLNEFNESNIIYKLRVYCKADSKVQTKRDCYRIVKLIFDKENITIPFNQIDIHTK